MKKHRNKRSAKLFLVRHKKIGLVLLVCCLIGALVGGFWYRQYLGKFSDKDYDRLGQAGEGIFVQTGAQDVKQDEWCRYRRPGEFNGIHLYCTVNVVARFNYESNDQLKEMVGKLEDNIAQLGQVYTSDLSQLPETLDRTSAIVTLSAPLPEASCSISAVSDTASKVQAHLGNTKSIELVFECSGESREEYFPVTYRQG